MTKDQTEEECVRVAGVIERMIRDLTAKIAGSDDDTDVEDIGDINTAAAKLIGLLDPEDERIAPVSLNAVAIVSVKDAAGEFRRERVEIALGQTLSVEFLSHGVSLVGAKWNRKETLTGASYTLEGGKVLEAPKLKPLGGGESVYEVVRNALDALNTALAEDHIGRGLNDAARKIRRAFDEVYRAMADARPYTKHYDVFGGSFKEPATRDASSYARTLKLLEAIGGDFTRRPPKKELPWFMMKPDYLSPFTYHNPLKW